MDVVGVVAWSSYQPKAMEFDRCSELNTFGSLSGAVPVGIVGDARANGSKPGHKVLTLNGIEFLITVTLGKNQLRKCHFRGIGPNARRTLCLSQDLYDWAVPSPIRWSEVARCRSSSRRRT